MIRNSEASRLQPSSPIASMKTIRAAFRSGFTTKLPVSQTRRFASAVATPDTRQIEAELRAAVEGRAS